MEPLNTSPPFPHGTTSGDEEIGISSVPQSHICNTEFPKRHWKSNNYTIVTQTTLVVHSTSTTAPFSVSSGDLSTSKRVSSNNIRPIIGVPMGGSTLMAVTIAFLVRRSQDKFFRDLSVVQCLVISPP